MKKFLGIIVVLLIIIGACTNNPQRRGFQKSPLDNIIRDLSNEKSYSIILYDMDYSESDNQYKHQYQILKERPDTILEEMTGWKNVNEAFFNAHINDMGMEIASKQNGKLSKTVAPAGYSNYVGNEKYGRWVQRDGGSFWEFYGKYMFMSSMFNLAFNPIRYSYWNDYHHNYSRYNRPYYGPMNTNGSRMYGTNGSYNKRSRANSTWNSKPNTFKQKVRSKAAQSKSSSFYGSKKRSSSSARKSRSSSRYRSSNYRSRGGSFGK